LQNFFKEEFYIRRIFCCS